MLCFADNSLKRLCNMWHAFWSTYNDKKTKLTCLVVGNFINQVFHIYSLDEVVGVLNNLPMGKNLEHKRWACLLKSKIVYNRVIVLTLWIFNFLKVNMEDFVIYVVIFLGKIQEWKLVCLAAHNKL